MNEALLSKEQCEIGYRRFLEQDPQLRGRVCAMTQETADALRMSLDDIHHIEIHRAIKERASAAGLDQFEYFLEFAVPDAEERRKIMQAQRDSISDALRL